MYYSIIGLKGPENFWINISLYKYYMYGTLDPTNVRTTLFAA